MNVPSIVQHYKKRIDNFLEFHLPSESTRPEELHRAMRYAVLNGGKRLRAVLIYVIGEAVNAKPEILDHVAAAIEMIHAFSLIHDDLPALDNDDLRRGKLSCHKAFDEATAILAGDALQASAFEMLARLRKKKLVKPNNCLEMIEVLSYAIGSRGMAGGEFLDVTLKDIESISKEKLEQIYKLKTSKLLLASIMLALLAGDCHKRSILSNMAHFGIDIGIAFQIHDDVIGLSNDTEVLGKPQYSDLVNNKPIYPTITNLVYSKKQEKFFYKKALIHLSHSGLPIKNIKKLADYLINRVY